MTTNDRDQEDMTRKCVTCSNTRMWHLKYDTQHEFNDGSIPVSQTFGKKLPDGSRAMPGATPVQTSVETAWPFDPVLRQALIDKGVLTPDDLIEARKKIEAVTSAVMEGR